VHHGGAVVVLVIYGGRCVGERREQLVTRSKSRSPAVIGLFALILVANCYFLVQDWVSADREWGEFGFRLFMATVWAVLLLRAIRRPKARQVGE
jgi:hypothetical protein